MLDYSDRPCWERARMQMYIQAQTMSKKKIKPVDIIKFKWDTENESSEVSDEEKKSLAARENEFLAVLEKKKKNKLKNVDNKQ